MEEFEKIIYLVKEISRENGEIQIVEILDNSELDFGQHWSQKNSSIAHSLDINVSPVVFTKRYKDIQNIERKLEILINNISQIYLENVTILPNYNRLEILNSEISSIITVWEDINQLQKKLIEDMKISNQEIDYQNIGNSSRNLMDKLARLVFDPSIHKSEKPNVDLSNGKFKNQFHTYISFSLKGESNKELKKFAESSIEFTEKAIDLMNQTTHKLDVKKHFAEVCVISTISVISLIKAINEL
jgi:hypothetical protein